MTKPRCGEMFVTAYLDTTLKTKYWLWVVDSFDKTGKPRVRNLETKSISKNIWPGSMDKHRIYVGKGLRHW